MQSTFELEIRSLLNKHGSVEKAATELVSYLESNSENFTQENILTLSNFLFQSHLYLLLVQFVLRNIRNESFYIPWGYFLEALAEIPFEITVDFKEALFEGILQTEAQAEAIRSKKWDSEFEEFMDWRKELRKNNKKIAQNIKEDLLDELALYRNANLQEKEKNLLIKLQKMFPNDITIKKNFLRSKERSALDILAKYSGRRKIITQENISKEEMDSLQVISESFLKASELNPEMALDFATACYMLEDYKTSLHILNSPKFESTNENKFKDWLEIELLIKLNRHLEALNLILDIEKKYASDPETFFSTAYLRALALWGLDQKPKAIEIMESLLISKPNFRLASSILSYWRNS